MAAGREISSTSSSPKDSTISASGTHLMLLAGVGTSIDRHAIAGWGAGEAPPRSCPRGPQLSSCSRHHRVASRAKGHSSNSHYRRRRFRQAIRIESSSPGIQRDRLSKIQQKQKGAICPRLLGCGSPFVIRKSAHRKLTRNVRILSSNNGSRSARIGRH
jgi:hypothetical protein